LSNLIPLFIAAAVVSEEKWKKQAELKDSINMIAEIVSSKCKKYFPSLHFFMRNTSENFSDA